MVAALESRFGSAHQQELHRFKFKSRLRRRDESLQELAGDLERLARLAYPSAPEEMKDLLAKERFIDAILDGDTRLRLKQSRPQSLRAALTLSMELESYRLASRQRDFQARGVNCDTAEGTSTEKPGRFIGNAGGMIYWHKLKFCLLKCSPPRVAVSLVKGIRIPGHSVGVRKEGTY